MFMEYFKNITNLREATLIYRRLAMLHHPDRGGDPETMKRINLDFQRFKSIIAGSSASFINLNVGDLVLINESNSVVTKVNSHTFQAKSLYTKREAVFCKSTGRCISNPKFRATSITYINNAG